jgi:hypothetical protein
VRRFRANRPICRDSRSKSFLAAEAIAAFVEAESWSSSRQPARSTGHETAIQMKNIDRPPITKDQADLNHPHRRANGELGKLALGHRGSGSSA